jgi:hypothetical protein
VSLCTQMLKEDMWIFRKRSAKRISASTYTGLHGTTIFISTATIKSSAPVRSAAQRREAGEDKTTGTNAT